VSEATLTYKSKGVSAPVAVGESLGAVGFLMIRKVVFILEPR